MGTLIGIITAIGLAAVTGPVQAWAGKYINRLRQIRSLARVKALYSVGDVIAAAYRDGVAEPFIENWYIASMQVGCIKLRSMIDSSHVLPMTNQEFEALQVVIDEGRKRGV